MVRAGSEASGPARLQHTVATEVAQGAVEHLWGRAHEWIREHCMDGHLFVPQLLREANKRVYRDILEKLGRNGVVDDRQASLSPQELVEAHPEAFTAGKEGCGRRRLCPHAWRAGHLAHCRLCQETGEIAPGCYMNRLLRTVEWGWSPTPRQAEYERLNWRSFEDDKAIASAERNGPAARPFRRSLTLAVDELVAAGVVREVSPAETRRNPVLVNPMNMVWRTVFGGRALGLQNEGRGRSSFDRCSTCASQG